MLGQYFASGTQRREARAEFLRTLSRAESGRWWPLREDEERFWQLRHEVAASALIARVPQEAINLYLVIGAVCARNSADNFDLHGDPEFGRGINSDLADLGREAATLIINLARSPGRHRITMRRDLQRLRQQSDALRYRFDWDRGGL
jgi:hypothetical protein